MISTNVQQIRSLITTAQRLLHRKSYRCAMTSRRPCLPAAYPLLRLHAGRTPAPPYTPTLTRVVHNLHLAAHKYPPSGRV